MKLRMILFLLMPFFACSTGPAHHTNGLLDSTGHNSHLVLISGQSDTVRAIKRINQFSGHSLLYQTDTIWLPAGKAKDISVEEGAKAEFYWPNGLKILLGPASGIRRDITNEQTLELNGEALFNIPDGHPPMRVHVKNSWVVADSGIFFIKGYSDDPSCKLWSLTAKLTTGGHTIRPSAAVSLNAITGAAAELTFSEGLFSDYQSDFISFENESAPSLVRYIGRWYRKKVVYNGGGPEKYYTGVFPTSDLSSLIQMMHSLKINIKEDKDSLIVE